MKHPRKESKKDLTFWSRSWSGCSKNRKMNGFCLN